MSSIDDLLAGGLGNVTSFAEKVLSFLETRGLGSVVSVLFLEVIKTSVGLRNLMVLFLFAELGKALPNTGGSFL